MESGDEDDERERDAEPATKTSPEVLEHPVCRGVAALRPDWSSFDENDEEDDFDELIWNARSMMTFIRHHYQNHYHRDITDQKHQVDYHPQGPSRDAKADFSNAKKRQLRPEKPIVQLKPQRILHLKNCCLDKDKANLLNYIILLT